MLWKKGLIHGLKTFFPSIMEKVLVSSVHHHPHVRENVDIILYNIIYIDSGSPLQHLLQMNMMRSHTHTHIIDIGGLSSVHCVALTGSEDVHSSNSVARLHQLIVV